jgi:hypothetical protein
MIPFWGAAWAAFQHLSKLKFEGLRDDTSDEKVACFIRDSPAEFHLPFFV